MDEAMTHDCRNPLHCIIPPYVLKHLAEEHSNPDIRHQAIAAIESSTEDRTTRTSLTFGPMAVARTSPTTQKYRLVYDVRNGGRGSLPGKLVRKEGDGSHGDPAIDEAYDHSGNAYDFYQTVFKRNSLDGKGMSLISSVHYHTNYSNAFWNGEQMVYGDGDGHIFTRFTKSLDVVGHELTHGVQHYESSLDYKNESGALNEHFADVMGTLIRQYHGRITADQDHWRIGSDILGPKVQAKCIRIMTGAKAYQNDPDLGTDPQPKHINNQYTGSDDDGGVHTNSGIPNHAFYLVATALGGYAWERAGLIWYKTLRNLNRYSNFQEAADMTYQVAGAEFGAGSNEQQAVQEAWKKVGITVP